MKMNIKLIAFIIGLCTLVYGCNSDSTGSGSNSDSDETTTTSEDGEPLSECTDLNTLMISSVSSTDDYDGDYGPENTIDNDLSSESRWSSNGTDRSIILDIGSSSAVRSISTAWYKADIRTIYFDVETSADNEEWEQVLSNASISDTESMVTFDVEDTVARYVKVIGQGNSESTWNSLLEVDVLGCGNTESDENESGDEDENEPETETDTQATDTTPSLPPITGETYTATPDSLNDVLEGAVGGDEVIVTGSGEISLKDLNFNSPVLIRAENIGGTTLINVSISNSNNVALQGFVFGPNDESTLVKIENSTNIRVLRNEFDHKDITESQTTIVLTGASQYIEIAYNEFRDKNLSDRGEKVTGSYIKTQFDDPAMTSNLHIHHNHFKNIAPYLVDGEPAGDSDREVIAMGIADSQDVVTNNVVEYNLFENTDGENEIITVKTSNNIFRYNTFKNSMGSLSFRLGSNNEAYGNYFFGTGSGDSVEDDNYGTGGVRVYGSGHKVYDNHMENLTGILWRRPILIDSGDTSESTGNDSHETPTNVDVYNNTIVDCVGGIYIGDEFYSKMPTDISIMNNTVIASEGILFNNVADQSSNTWSGNVAYATGSAVAVAGGVLSSSEVQTLSSSPSISTPTPLTSSDVGTMAD